MIKKKNPTQEDLETWKNYIKNPTDIVDKDEQKLAKKDNFRFKYDLHGYSLSNANEKIEELILDCINKKFKELLIITGKGIHSNTSKDVYVSSKFSKLKYSVPDFINSKPSLSKYVSSISTANLKDGGDGAIIIKLKL